VHKLAQVAELVLLRDRFRCQRSVKTSSAHTGLVTCSFLPYSDACSISRMIQLASRTTMALNDMFGCAAMPA
jgi:hypothetical protein